MSSGVRELDIRISSTKVIHGSPMSDTTIAYIFSFLRRFNVLVRQQIRKEWYKLTDGEEIEGKTVGIVDLGEIGTHVAKK